MQKFSAMKLAEEIKVNLGAKHPTFVKTMVRSNVTTGYWLHLPMQFCKLHMPRHNATIVLEDEKGDEYKVNYLVDKSGVSGGWKVFTNAHNLIEGDILIFQLIRSSKFKIYIVRGNGPNEADVVPAVPTAETSTRHIASEDKKGKRIKFNRNASYLEIVPLNGLSNKIHKDDSLIGDDNLEHQADQSSKEKDGDASDLQIVPLNASPNINYEHDPMVVNGSLAHRVDHSREEHESTLGDMEAVDGSGPGLDFERVKSFEDFIILVNGVSIDSELSEHYRIKYFELCCKQKSFLHDHLLKKFNFKLAVEMITETVNIAEAIRVCTLSTFKANHAIWDKTLEGFERVSHNSHLFRFSYDPSATLGLDIASCILTRAPVGQNAEGKTKYVIRPYTPISDPDAKGHFDLLIKVYPEGKMSQHFATLKPGDVLEVKGPIEKLRYTPNMKKHIGMIAGGTGITPMLQIIEAILRNPDDNTQISLLYANVSPDDILLKQKLDALAASHPNLKVFYTVDNPSKNWKGGSGYLSKDMVVKGLPSSGDDTLVLVCGPPGMMKHVSGEKAKDYSQGEVSGILKELGFTEQMVYKF